MLLLPNLTLSLYPWSVIANIVAITRKNVTARPTMFDLKPATSEEFEASWQKCQETPDHVLPINVPETEELKAEIKLTLIYHMPTLPQILRSAPKNGKSGKEPIKPWDAINGFAPGTIFDPTLFPDTRVFFPKGRVPRVVFIDCRPHLDFHMMFNFKFLVPVQELIQGNTLYPLPSPKKVSFLNTPSDVNVRMRTATEEGVAGLNNLWKTGELCTGSMGAGITTRATRCGSFIGGCVSWMQDWVNQKPNTDLMGRDAEMFLQGLVETNTQLIFSPPENTKEWWKDARKTPEQLENLCLPPLTPFPVT